MKMSHNDDELSNWCDDDLYVDLTMLYIEYNQKGYCADE